MLNRSFHPGPVSEVCEDSCKFILACQTLSLLMSSISELKMFVEYHSIQMLNRSFQPGLILEVCEISYKFILASSRQTFSLLMSSISELKMFVEYH